MPPKPREARARVTVVRPLTPDVLEADLAMQEPPALDFEAGQWISVPLAAKVVRAYSIASSPRVPSQLTLCADVAPAGPGSRWFRGLRPGDEVAFKGPLGGFVLDPADRRRLLCVAEEIGIVPIRAMLNELAASDAARSATLVYWARDAGWLVYDAELRALARRTPAFAYHPLVRGQGEAAGLAERLAVDATDLVAYVAGGEATIHAVRAALMARGLPRKAIKWEKFW